MNPARLFEALLLVAAAVFAWWASRSLRRDGRRQYWRATPLARLRYLIAAQGLSGASIAFFFDLLRGGTGDRAIVLLFAIVAALIVAALFLMRARATRREFMLAVLVIAVVFGTISTGMGHVGSEPASITGMTFDGAAMLVSMALSSLAYRVHIATEGSRQLRSEAELALAHRLQSILVPPVIFRNARLEIYGRAIPSEKVGGDLVDVLESDGAVLAYLVDVSGHGIPAGTLMGAVKAAVRAAASLPLGETLETVNRVLPSVKEPAMYATLAAIRLGSTDTDVEYTLAGHLPILHYRAAAGTVEELTLRQFPLGFFDGARYETRRVTCAPGDMFALFSDGIVESADAADEHFGIHRLAEQLAATAARSLDEVFGTVISAASAHGVSHDDRSMLVVRIL
jgi:serine phosphatase RsbU (regulator of sigma subunit)